MAPDELLRRRSTSLEELRKLSGDGTLYAIVDACHEPEVPPKMAGLPHDRMSCLHQGRLTEEEAAVAPYLVTLDGDLLDWVLSTFEDRPWGLFVVAKCDHRTLRQHLRELMVVEGIDGRPMYFFFYNPQVLGPFLETCDAEELEGLYGPIMAWGLRSQGEDPVELIIRA